MFKIVGIALILFLAIALVIVILIIHKRRVTEILSIHTFLGNSSYQLLHHEPMEEKISFLEKMKKFFDEHDHGGNGDIDDDGGDDGGE
ncbi:hypothetical protein [Neobacillus jeddahensis]|uniref:hypothetical protein n=1 Tax=Neobacillus jeddahensis TaxID=1461580 RepID=UPI00058C5834|nr:hypothetical protein [Neobacillus jeddahensis]